MAADCELPGMRFAHDEGRMTLHTYGFTCGKKKLFSGLLPAKSRSEAITVLRSTGCEVHLVTGQLTDAQQTAWKLAAATGPIDADRARNLWASLREANP